MTGSMALLLGYALLLSLLQISHCADHDISQKRSILDMARTLWCYRDYLYVPLLGINKYGCFCGTGGQGEPVDGVDECCFLHDCCYEYATEKLKCKEKTKWAEYSFKCVESHTHCKSNTVCGKVSCLCDQMFSECLTEAHPSFGNYFYDRDSLCAKEQKPCPPFPEELRKRVNFREEELKLLTPE